MKAYTLIELIIATMLLILILAGGTNLFFQNLRTSGLSEVELSLTSNLQQAITGMEGSIRFGEILGVDTSTRQDCITAGDLGQAGSSVTLADINGLVTVYSIIGDRIASTSAETGRTVFLTTPNIKIESMDAIWYCRGNIGDRLQLTISASSTILSTGLTVNREISTDIDLLNSGIN